ncbi:DNA-packaging protein [Xanthobacter tagetidis]|uniref:ATP-binding protein n=1 Tax=Xanthobacter tagetidis TaxID=60216 RepID=A0A3L7AGB9_9HYPH|nr:terminase family protein [Xanthobacter tagetidis]MBB6306234.1 putative phage terminase large subunit-like protein [Xanthobacter tagetidis]RLP79516.1 ATP-binding protein [Xanthobacter tagetidis]
MPEASFNLSSLASLPPHQRDAILARLTDKECQALLHDWQFVARPNQLPPDGDWLIWLILAGRGFGKTRTGAEWVREQLKAGASRLGLIAPTASDARDVMVEGESGLLAVCWAGDRTNKGEILGRPQYEPSKRRLTWANGAMATLFSAEEPERLRGPQHDRLWCDELAAWKHLSETWDMAMFGLRLGSRPRTCITTTPKPKAALRKIIADTRTVITRGSTFDNAGNLAPEFLQAVKEKYEGTRLGRQELNAEMLDDVPGALWTAAMLEAARVSAVPDMQRVVVAIDPSGTKGQEDRGDSVGIVVAGKGVDGLAYVLADRTCKLSPDGWGRRATAAYREFKADRIVAERNFGGAMVEHVIRTVDPTASYREVTASRGKVARAEPVAALYEQGRVKHLAAMSDLEDQMTGFTADGYVGEGSPDRVDAAVWALTELMLKDEAPTLQVGRQIMRR